jgi:hypothetical protein
VADAKLEVKIGAITFTGEGTEKWLAEQLEVIIKAAPKLSELAPPPAEGADRQQPGQSTKPAANFTSTLAAHLTAKNAGTNQTKRFLVTADWLRNKGQALSTGAVAKALKDAHQTKLSNPSQSLAENVTKGHTEKDGSGGFFITPEGLKSLGYSA